jgi:stage II sporulation protein M
MIGVTGYLMGTLAVLSSQGIGTVILSLAPHGIFELPALILAGAWSLRMAISWLLPAAAGRRGDVWRGTIVEGLWLIPVIVGLLAIAAVVEVLVTAPLVRGMMGA